MTHGNKIRLAFILITWMVAGCDAAGTVSDSSDAGTMADAMDTVDTDSGTIDPPPDSGTPTEDTSVPVDPPPTGAVFALTNAPDGNAVEMFSRDADGMLTLLGEFATGDFGTGEGLGSQSSIALNEDHSMLFVVNAGSSTVSSLRIYDDHLALMDTIPSGGEKPTSLVMRDSRLYVLNAAGAGSVAGFTVDASGMFAAIDGSERPLSGAETTAPGQVGLTPEGDWLVVTEKATSQIVTYAVAADGSLGEPVVNASEGMTPFGFDFTSTGVLLVSEAFGGMPGLSAVSSYRVSDGGSLWTFSASVPNGESASCWVRILRDDYAYTTNTKSNTVSGYEISNDGSINLFAEGGEGASFGDEQGPIDIAASADESYLYVLNAKADGIVSLAVGDDGRLSQVGVEIDVPETTVGLAAF